MLLHGLGADGNDLIRCQTLRPVLPRARFLPPDAPHPWGGTGPGCEWFAIRTFAALEIVRGTKSAWPPLRQFLLEQRALYAPKHLVLLGFSQGAMMALYAASQRDVPLSAVVSFAGCLLLASKAEQG